MQGSNQRLLRVKVNIRYSMLDHQPASALWISIPTSMEAFFVLPNSVVLLKLIFVAALE
jgi:hypothetical protein